jgi:glutamine amidotransferase
MLAAGITEPLRVTAALTNGDRVYAVRYASDEQPPTLYAKRMVDREGMLIVSEPLDDSREGWQAIPPQHVATVSPTAIATSPLPRFSALQS